MFDFQTLLIIFGIITFSFGLMFDSYSFLVKGYVSKENSRVIIAYGNSIQYISRIFFMLTLLIITFSFEQLGNTNALKIIISNGLLIGILFSLFQINKIGQVLMTFFSRPLSHFFYKSIENEILHSSKTINEFNIFSKYSLLSSTVNVLLLSAILIPISLAIIYPEHRMLLTYLGQLFNFFSTAIVFLVLEPILFSAMDKTSLINRRETIAETIFFSKIISYIVVMLGLYFLI